MTRSTLYIIHICNQKENVMYFFEDGKPDSTFCSTERIENWQRLLQLDPDVPSDARTKSCEALYWRKEQHL